MKATVFPSEDSGLGSSCKTCSMEHQVPEFATLSSPQTPVLSLQGHKQKSSVDLSAEVHSLGSGATLGALTTFSVNPLFTSPAAELHTQLRRATDLKTEMKQLQTRLNKAWLDLECSDSEPDVMSPPSERPTPVAAWFNNKDAGLQTKVALLDPGEATARQSYGPQPGLSNQGMAPTAESHVEGPVDVQELLKELSLHSVPSEADTSVELERLVQGVCTPRRAAPTALDLQQLARELDSAAKENVFLRAQVNRALCSSVSLCLELPICAGSTSQMSITILCATAISVGKHVAAAAAA